LNIRTDGVCSNHSDLNGWSPDFHANVVASENVAVLTEPFNSNSKPHKEKEPIIYQETLLGHGTHVRNCIPLKMFYSNQRVHF
jgi:hypothetical protein